VPLTRPSAYQSDRREVLRLAGRLSRGLNLRDYWQLEDHTLGQLSSRIFRTARRTKIACKGTTSCRVLCIAAASLLRLPRCARHGELRATPKAREPNMPRLPRPRFAERTAHGDLAEHTHHKEGSTGSECIACTCQKSRSQFPRLVSAHTFAFITPAMTDKYKIPPVHIVP